ncbi:TPA: metal-dependent hydrolase [Thermoplasmata archaeon]|nr:metal-dependent hydrolase [Thermoplasmata archaeon]
MSAPILDNHVHLEPRIGRNVDAVRDFERLGGTHLIVSHLPYSEVRVNSAEDFRSSYDVTVSTVERINSETGVKAFATVGPYPVELLGFERRLGLEAGKDMMIAGMDIAAEFVREGKALAIGEVGRPHFPVPEDVWKASNEILLHGMRLAQEVDCAIVLHTESGTPRTMVELAEMADSVGLDRGRVVKHYSPPAVLPEENSGLMPSVLAGKEAVQEALSKGTRFMMETDFLDDPRRPGAVLAITTVPKRTKTLIERGQMTEEQAYVIHRDNPSRTYGPAFG